MEWETEAKSFFLDSVSKLKQVTLLAGNYFFISHMIKGLEYMITDISIDS